MDCVILVYQLLFVFCDAHEWINLPACCLYCLDRFVFDIVEWLRLFGHGAVFVDEYLDAMLINFDQQAPLYSLK